MHYTAHSAEIGHFLVSFNKELSNFSEANIIAAADWIHLHFTLGDAIES